MNSMETVILPENVQEKVETCCRVAQKCDLLSRRWYIRCAYRLAGFSLDGPEILDIDRASFYRPRSDYWG